MPVVAIDLTRREPYAGGQAFGDTGPYERLDGTITFAVDPEHLANAAITDLKLAPRDAQGRVRFTSDLCLLLPVDQARGNRRLFIELPNRGRKLLPRQLNRARPEPPTPAIPPGDGFLFRQGYAVGWIGWQWDVYRGDTLMGLEAPEALIDGQRVRGQTVVDIRPNARQRTRLLANRVHKPYPAADLTEAGARLLVRDWEDGENREVPREQWRFARETPEGVVPDAEHIYLEPGFEPGKIYTVLYTAEGAPVVGTGLLAFREIASFLRYDPRSPLAGNVDYAYGFGISQTGRMIRHYIYLGLNQDEAGRVAYDGLLPHVAGARRGEFNHRFGQPSVQTEPSFGHLFPYADAELPDPYGGDSDGLLKRLRAQGQVPKIFYTNSAAEYWRGDAALLHIDPTGTRDLPDEPESRKYLFASTQHGPGTLPFNRSFPDEGDIGRHDFNVVDYTPLLRAALVNLDRWVSQGVEPPPSKHPRLDDGTAVPAAQALAGVDGIPGIHLPDPARLPTIRKLDLGHQANQGIGHFPAEKGPVYPNYVSAVDADGNETGGIRPADVSVPLGTFTGWNPRAPETGAPEQILKMQGITHFFRPTRAERLALDDPRPSLEERYPSKEAYLARVRQAAVALVAERYALEEDIERIVADAAERWDTAIQGQAIELE
ncbi:MAG TPA: alpha/beta hydrolase domain-containing protein [Nitrolancea sp.]|nr:alpha/beta hydrolase domain-containing protein [Nitrolancea sp.]